VVYNGSTPPTGSLCPAPGRDRIVCVPAVRSMEGRGGWDDGGFLVVTLRARFDPSWKEVQGDKQEPRPRVGGSCTALGAWRDALSPPMDQDDTSWTLAFVLDASLPEVAFKFALELDDEEPNEAGDASWRSTKLAWEEGEERTIASGRVKGSLQPHANFRLQDGSQVNMAVGVTIERTSATALARAFRAMESAAIAKARKQARDLCHRKRQGGFNTAQTLHGSKLMTDREEEVLDEGADIDRKSSAQTLATMAASEPEARPIADRKEADVSDTAKEGKYGPLDPGIGTSGTIREELETADSGLESALMQEEQLLRGMSGVSCGSKELPTDELSPGKTLACKDLQDNAIMSEMQRTSPGGGNKEVMCRKANLIPGPVAAEEATHMYSRKRNRRCLAIVMVGLPARGKSFTATKLMRYLKWMGHNVELFNVGKYRRRFHGKATGTGSWIFDADNPEGQEARRICAKMAMDDMLSWFEQGGQIGIYGTSFHRFMRYCLLAPNDYANTSMS